MAITYIQFSIRRDRSSTEEQRKAEAHRLVPKFARAQAEKLFRAMKGAFKLDSFQRSAFIHDFMRPYLRRSSPEYRKMLAHVETALRKWRVSGKSDTPFG
jgi:hypothetical protein